MPIVSLATPSNAVKKPRTFIYLAVKNDFFIFVLFFAFVWCNLNSSAGLCCHYLFYVMSKILSLTLKFKQMALVAMEVV